jgi:hypothetical protein
MLAEALPIACFQFLLLSERVFRGTVRNADEIYMQPAGFLHRAGLLHRVHASMHGFPRAFLLLSSPRFRRLLLPPRGIWPGRRLGGEDFPREGDKRRVRFISRLNRQLPFLTSYASFQDGLIK